jgi:hypothetical protein
VDSVYVEIVGLEDILKLLSWLSYPGTLHKDVCGALGMHSVSVEVVGLEELGPELLFTEGNNSIAAMDCLHSYITNFGLTFVKMSNFGWKMDCKNYLFFFGEKWIISLVYSGHFPCASS